MNKVVVVCFIVFFICELNAQLTSKLVSFGKNNHGQSGTNSISNIQIPTLTQDIGDVKDFAVGSSSVVAISVQNGVTSLWTWGSNSAGQLGVGSSINSSLVPIKMDLSATSLAGRIPSEVSIGASFVLVKATDNTLHAFGDNTYGQLGIGNTDGQFTPRLVNTSALDGKTIQQFATGNVHSLILTDTLYAFGGNSFGQLGDGTNISQSFPVAVKLTGINLRVTMIAAGSFHTLFMTSDERLYAFGSNTFGDLGDGTTTDRFTYVQVITNGLLSNSTITKISSGFHYNLILTKDYKVYGFGYNGYGQLGDGTTVNKNSLTSIPLTKKITHVEAGYVNSLMLTIAYELLASGNNDNYQLGLGSTSPVISSVPVRVSLNGSLSSNTPIRLSKLGTSSMMMAMVSSAVWSCEGVSNSNPSVCSGQGVCKPQGTCECLPGFVGPNCQSIASQSQLPLSPFTFVRGAIYEKQQCSKKEALVGTSLFITDKCYKYNDGFQKLYCNGTHLVARFCYSDQFCFNSCTDTIYNLDDCLNWNVTDLKSVSVKFQCNNDPSLPRAGFYYDLHSLSGNHNGNCSTEPVGKLVLEPICKMSGDNTTSSRYQCVSGNRTLIQYSTPNCTGVATSDVTTTVWKQCLSDGSILRGCNQSPDETSHLVAIIPMGIIGTIFTISPYLLFFGLIIVILAIIVIVLVVKMKGNGKSIERVPSSSTPKAPKAPKAPKETVEMNDLEDPQPEPETSRPNIPPAPSMALISKPKYGQIEEVEDHRQSSIPVKMTIPDSFNTEWYYLDEEFEQHGPITVDDLIDLYSKKTINNQTQVFGGEMEEWATISTQGQLQNLLLILSNK